MDANRQLWNERQQELRKALARPADQQRGLELFLIQHAALHSSSLSSTGLWSFADEVLEGLGEGVLRCIPPKGEHSIAWVLWHMTRIEDMTMNVLVAGGSQVFCRENWPERLGVAINDTGNAMDLPAVARFQQAGRPVRAGGLPPGGGPRDPGCHPRFAPRETQNTGRSGAYRTHPGGRRCGGCSKLAAGLLGWADHRRAAADAADPPQFCPFE